MYDDAVADDVTNKSTVTAKTNRQTTTHWAPRPESPLHHIVHEPAPEHPTVTLEELPGMSHLILRGNSGNAAFVDGVSAALGIALPCKPCTCTHNKSLRVAWQSPDEWLIIAEPGQATKIETTLRHHLSGHFAVTDISGGQTLVLLSGSNAENVLKKSTLFDVHIDYFPTGSAVGVTFGKSQVFLRRTGEHSFELIVRRSFADYLWQWLLDTCGEYGVKCQTKRLPENSGNF